MNFIFLKIRMNLVAQMIFLISIVVLISLFVGHYRFSTILEDILEQYLGQQAMTVAKVAATDEDIIAAFKTNKPASIIQPIAEELRRVSGASYVVIGNRDGIRYSHFDPSKIGGKMGTPNDMVFEERRSVIFRGLGASGEAIKAKTPIYDEQGELIGVSSVGFLMNDVEKRMKEFRVKIIKLTLLLLAIGVSGAFLIAKRVKNMIFGLEPEEISFLFKEKEAILESIRDATVAIDMEERVISLNRRARELLLDEHLTSGWASKNPRLKEIMNEVMKTAKGQINQNIIIGCQVFVVDSSPIIQNHTVKGAVFTFRPESEIAQLTDEFTKIKVFSENMRSLNHEYLNRLNTIYGLLNLKEYDKAVELISDEVKERQDMIAFLMSSVNEPFIAACLLGKINRSKELKVGFDIDQDSYLTEIPQPIDTKILVTILGNIIDNAFEASLENSGPEAYVKVSFTDLGRDIIFDVEDNGMGIPKEKEKDIFISGYSTKAGENRGLGLAIVKHSLELLKGQLYITKSSLGGSRFTIVIPKSS
jgi:two-component system CitB family sensor kinase